MGSFFSGAADGDGASPFWNPAGMMFTRGTRFDVSTALTYVRVNYDQAGTDGASNANIVAPTPFVGAVTDVIGERWRLGVSAGVPYVAGAAWDEDGAEVEVTRYYAERAYVLHGVVTPAVSYQLGPHWSVGGGINLSYSRIEADFDKNFAGLLNGAIGADVTSGPFRATDPELAAPVRLRSAGFGYGALLGVALSYDRVRAGASLHSPIYASTSGTVDAQYPETMVEFVQMVAPGANLPDLNGKLEIKARVPLVAFLAVVVQPREKWEVTLDYRYANTSSESKLNVLISESTAPDLQDTEVVKGTRDKHSVGLRARRELIVGRAFALMRARYENNTIDELTTTPNNADFHKLELGAALRWHLGRNADLALQYSHFFLIDTVVDNSLHQPNAVPSLDAYNHPSPVGRYAGAVDQFSLAFGYVY